VTKLLKYEIRPSDLPVVLVNGKKHFLKYTTGAYFVLFFHMLTRCVFSATPNLSSICCQQISNCSGILVPYMQE
jgi:hypothetical protein